MALQCSSSPTLTSSGVGTTHSVSTTVSLYVTTPPGSVFTTLVATCAPVSNSTICETATRVVTQPATPFTTEAQVVVTVDVPYSYTTTLYGSSCTTTAPVPSDPSPVLRSPIVSTFTSSSIYTSDGSTYVTVVTSLTSVAPAQSTSASPGQSSSSNSNIPAIVGGALGGLSALALLIILLWKFLKKPRISFDDEDYSDFNDLTKQQQVSTTYNYSPVAAQDSQTAANALSDAGLQPTGYGNDAAALNHGYAGADTTTQYAGPTSNPVGPGATFNETGFQPGGNDVMYNVPNHGPVHQIPIPSISPLLAGAAAIPSAGPAARPNTTSSSATYVPSSDPTGQQMNYVMGYVPQQYPSGLAQYPQQPYGSPLQGQGQGPLNHNHSVGSAMTMTTSSGPTGSGTGPCVDPMPSLMTQPGQVYPDTQPYLSFAQQSYRDTLSGSQSVGSVGPIDNRMLQVMNPEPDSFAQGSSTSDPGFIVGPSSSTSTPPPIDGKGRPLDTRGEKAAIVHLDGGAYNESSVPAPPAYRE